MTELRWTGDKRLTQLDGARIAAGILFSVLASVWLINEGDVRLAVLRWLLIIVTIGLIINSQEGITLRPLAVASGSCSLSAFSGVYFQSFLICRQDKVISPPLLSGVNMCAENASFIAGFLLILLVLSTLGIFLSGICRPVTVEALKGLPRYADKAESIEKNLRAIIISIGGIFVVLKMASVL